MLLNRREAFPANLEPLRKKFNEEQAHARHTDSPPIQETSPVHSAGTSGQESPDSTPVQDREGGTRSTGKGDTGEGRRHRRKRSPNGYRKGRRIVRSEDSRGGGKGGSPAADEDKGSGGEADAVRISEVGSMLVSSSKEV